MRRRADIPRAALWHQSSRNSKIPSPASPQVGTIIAKVWGALALAA
jgi:hypothetical protein